MVQDHLFLVFNVLRLNRQSKANEILVMYEGYDEESKYARKYRASHLKKYKFMSSNFFGSPRICENIFLKYALIYGTDRHMNEIPNLINIRATEDPRTIAGPCIYI